MFHRLQHLFSIQLLCTIAILFSLSACGPRYLRDGDDDDFESSAMSTKLDKKDLKKLFDKNLASLLKHKIVKTWKNKSRDGQEVNIAVLDIDNNTSEKIGSALNALLGKFETKLVNEGEVVVVDKKRQDKMIQEVYKQKNKEFDPQRVAQFGRQLGVQYVITGKIESVTEKNDDGKRVQYSLFMQVIEVETSAIRWQEEAEVMKGIAD
jgi:uncharacterized protein (TIGR02722 family)